MTAHNDLKAYARRRRRLSAGLALGLVTVLSMLAYLLWHEYELAIREAETRTHDFAAVLEARLDATLRTADAQVIQLKRGIPEEALERGAVPRFARQIDTELNLRLSHFPELSAIRIFDAEGNLLYSSHRDSIKVAVNIAEDSHFRRLRDGAGDELEFSDVLVSRATGDRILSLARALRGPRGEFLGAVSTSLRIDYFVDLFSRLNLGDGGNVAVYRRDDYRLVMRWPQIEANFNKALPADSPTRQAFADGNDKSTMQVLAAADGRVRIYSYDAVESYPFFVSVGMARDTVLADWRMRSIGVTVFAGGLLIALGVLVLQWLRAEASVARFNVELEARVRERTAELESFSYSISHDLRTPLRGIAGIARILETDYATSLDHTAKDLLVRMRESAQRMGGLIEDLLKLSRLTRAEVLLETVDLAALARNVFEDLRAGEPQRRVALVVPEKLEVRGDRRLLALVLENLLGNAWKFTARKDDARIELGADSKDDGTPVYFVRDNGAGFDPAHAQHLFAPFHRLHRDDEFPGTGIGLATVQRIIRRHGGDIRAEGVPGKGAVFYFTLSA